MGADHAGVAVFWVLIQVITSNILNLKFFNGRALLIISL
jgi:hypothetical protein